MLSPLVGIVQPLDPMIASQAFDAYSPEWWVNVLVNRLEMRAIQVLHFQAYYEGRHRLSYAGARWRTAFGHLFTHFADNWCQLVVDAVAERLNVEGFRMTDEPKGDSDAWDIWQRNQLDHDSNLAHVEALAASSSYAIVWPGDDGEPRITVESPLQVTVAYAPDDRRKRLAAIKCWQDDFGSVHCTLYLPDGVYKYTRASGSGTKYAPRVVPESEPWPLPNPLGVVPVVELRNRPRLSNVSWGMSEIENVIPQQDALNKLLADMLIASEYAAYRQRWAIGLDVPLDPETGKPIEPFKSAVDRLWVSESPDTKFGEFSPTDLTNYVAPIEMLVQHIAAQSSTPPHYFYLKGQFPSGESIKSAESSLVAKARNRMRNFEEGWEEIMRLAFAVLDDPRQYAWTAETIWADPEYRTEGEHVDALVKLRSIAVPIEQLWQDAGYTPQQIARFQSMRASDALLNLMTMPVTTAFGRTGTEFAGSVPQVETGQTAPTAPPPP